MIGLVTDSGSQIPPVLRDRFGVQVVPVTVVVDGEPHEEGVDLDPDEFYARLGAGAEVSTAAPSPGRVLEAWGAAVAGGATEILSIHVGSNTSGTVNAAKVAVGMCDVGVTILDSGTASFPVACCVWGAASVRARGGTIGEAADAARAIAEQVDNVFIVGALDLARRGGRLADDAEAASGVPVLALRSGTMEVVGQAPDRETAVEAMTGYLRSRAGGRAQRVGVGHAGAAEIAEDLASGLEGTGLVQELVRYDVGPSIGAHTGPGTVGCVFYPDDLVA